MSLFWSKHLIGQVVRCVHWDWQTWVWSWLFPWGLFHMESHRSLHNGHSAGRPGFDPDFSHGACFTWSHTGHFTTDTLLADLGLILTFPMELVSHGVTPVTSQRTLCWQTWVWSWLFPWGLFHMESHRSLHNGHSAGRPGFDPDFSHGACFTWSHTGHFTTDTLLADLGLILTFPMELVSHGVTPVTSQRTLCWQTWVWSWLFPWGLFHMESHRSLHNGHSAGRPGFDPDFSHGACFTWSHTGHFTTDTLLADLGLILTFPMGLVSHGVTPVTSQRTLCWQTWVWSWLFPWSLFHMESHRSLHNGHSAGRPGFDPDFSHGACFTWSHTGHFTTDTLLATLSGA